MSRKELLKEIALVAHDECYAKMRVDMYYDLSAATDIPNGNIESATPDVLRKYILLYISDIISDYMIWKKLGK